MLPSFTISGAATRRAVMVGMCFAATARAQTSCANGASGASSATIGVSWYECHGPCSIGVETPSGLADRFSVEPALRGIDARGPSAGVLHDGDVLLAVDGALITTPAAGRIMANLEVQRPVALHIRRDGVETDVVVTPAAGCVRPRLVVRDHDEPRAAPPAVMPPVYFGMSIDCGDCGWRQQPDGQRAFFSDRFPLVATVAPNGPAARAGVVVGDLLIAMNGTRLLDASGRATLGQLVPGRDVRLTVLRGSSTLELHIVPAASPKPD